MYYWEACSLGQRLLLTGYANLIPNSLGIVRVIIALLVNMIFSSLLISLQPYKKFDLNVLAISSATMQTCAFFAAVSPNIRAAGTKCFLVPSHRNPLPKPPFPVPLPKPPSRPARRAIFFPWLPTRIFAPCVADFMSLPQKAFMDMPAAYFDATRARQPMQDRTPLQVLQFHFAMWEMTRFYAFSECEVIVDALIDAKEDFPDGEDA